MNTITEVSVNLSDRPVAVKPAIKNRINRAINKLGNYHNDGVPLEDIFQCLKAEGVTPLQEDGTEWSGLFCGAAECGSDEARKQVALFQLAIWDESKSCHRLTTLGLCVSWGTLYRPNGTRRWEFVAYVN